LKQLFNFFTEDKIEELTKFFKGFKEDSLSELMKNMAKNLVGTN
jgi:hypothetical protein